MSHKFYNRVCKFRSSSPIKERFILHKKQIKKQQYFCWQRGRKADIKSNGIKCL